jgi:hypothetical protein
MPAKFAVFGDELEAYWPVAELSRIRGDLVLWQCWYECLRKGNDQMASEHTRVRQVPCGAVALVGVMLFACGCTAPTSPEVADAVDVDASTDDGGLPTKGDKDAGVGDKEGGLGMKDAGLGTEDSGSAGDDGGTTIEDAGTGIHDAGTGPEDAGMPGQPDAGEMNECFACAEKKCAVEVNACLRSPACVEEGNCDLMCLGASAGPLAVPDPRCVQACTKNLQATQELLAAVTCGFTVCPVQCLRPLASCGGDAGGFGVPVKTGGDPGCFTGWSGGALP